MTEIRNIDGHYFPAPHPGWGGFAEELFHYTSRYYTVTEAFVASISGDPGFSMNRYKAALLSERQREMMAAVLSCEPDSASARAVVAIVEAVLHGTEDVAASVGAQYGACLERLPKANTVEHRTHFDSEGSGVVDPLDPFMSLADGLQMPVAVRDGHVEVSLRELATHLQSANSTLRTNLHNAIIALHNAGYVLRNHPHLTHGEARAISDDDA